jgi:exodeoxyribonuclease VII small subunit
MDKLTFEQAISELEEIIKRLEDGKIPLEEAVKAFERGSELRAFCETRLAEAQLKIEILSEKKSENNT